MTLKNIGEFILPLDVLTPCRKEYGDGSVLAFKFGDAKLFASVFTDALWIIKTSAEGNKITYPGSTTTEERQALKALYYQMAIP